MTNSSIPDGLLNKLLRYLDVPSAVRSKVLKAVITDACLKNDTPDRAELTLRHLNGHLTTYSDRLHGMEPARDAIRVQYIRDQHNLEKANAANNVEYDNLLRQKVEAGKEVFEMKQEVAQRKSSADGANSKKRYTSRVHSAGFTCNAKCIEAFMQGLGNPDVVWSCTRVNLPAGGP